jgi:hypothetical protein
MLPGQLHWLALCREAADAGGPSIDVPIAAPAKIFIVPSISSFHSACPCRSHAFS